MDEQDHIEQPEHVVEPEQPTPQVIPIISGKHPVLQGFKFVFDILKTVVIVLVIALVIRYFLIQPYIVDGSSMEPNLHNHEYLIVQKVDYALHTPGRGDIIVFRYPKDPSLNYVKRIIGLPGDRVVVANGKVSIFNNNYPSGLQLKEPYLPPGQLTTVNGDGREYSWVVDANDYFVMGDNRDHSDDSRSWGFVPKANIVGKVWVTVFPFNEAGVIHHATY